MIEFQTFDQTAFRVARFAELYHWLVWPWDTMALLERRGVGDVAARGWFSNPMGQRIPRLQLSIEHSRVCIVARQSSRSDTSYCIVQAIPLSIQSTRNLLFSLSRDCRFAQSGSNNRKSFKGTLKFCCCKISKKNKKKKQKDPSPELNNRGRRRKKCDEWGNNARRG